MKQYTKLSRENVYRNSKIWYVESQGESKFSKNLIHFCRKYAGKKILDFGCATGDYCLELKRLGFECVGVDINEQYVKIAWEKGVNAHLIKDKVAFEDKSFDTVILFEVLEHIQNPDKILKEAKRVAKKNILITVPDCGGFEILRNYRLTYEHFLELDHINFFTKEDLENLLLKHFRKFKIEEREPILLGKADLPWWIRKPVAILYKLKFIKTNIYYRLYAVVDLNKE